MLTNHSHHHDPDSGPNRNSRDAVPSTVPDGMLPQPSEAPIRRPLSNMWITGFVLLLAMVAYLVGVQIDAFDWFVAWSRRHEDWQVDDLILIPPVLFVAILILLTLRSRELQREIERRVVLERQLRELAVRDPLTGLLNRTAFMDRLWQANASARRTGQTLAVLFIDLDNFKAVNDRYGHAAGDRVLTAIAGRLVDGVRANDTVGRISGDEFVVLLENLSSTEPARDTAARLLDALSAPIASTPRPHHVTTSIGIAFGPVDEAPESLLHAADEAMYLAKRDGKNQFALATSNLSH